jgi:hypothetical protein
MATTVGTGVVKAIPGNWRVLIRFSLDYDASSKIRNAIVPVLKQCGIRRTKTGTWQSRLPHPTPEAAARQLSRVLKMLSDPRGHVSGTTAHARLDHIWFYIERVR